MIRTGLVQTGEDPDWDQIARDAGNAAREEAEQGPWPPTRESVQAIAAAAGTAACAAYPPTAPVSALCGLVAGFVAGVVYDVVDGLVARDAGAQDIERMQWIADSTRGALEFGKVIEAQYGIERRHIADCLRHYGANVSDDLRPWGQRYQQWVRDATADEGVGPARSTMLWDRTVAGVRSWQRKVFAAAVACAAFYEVRTANKFIQAHPTMLLQDVPQQRGGRIMVHRLALMSPLEVEQKYSDFREAEARDDGVGTIVTVSAAVAIGMFFLRKALRI